MRISDWSSDVCSSDLFLLREGAIAMQHLHVAAVGKRAIEHLGRIWHPAQHLGDGSIFTVGELYAFELEDVIDMPVPRRRRHEHVTQIPFFCFLIEDLHNRYDLSAV